MASNTEPGGEGKKWERAWTAEEMREAAHTWSLAGDSGMLNHLHDFSKRLLARVHDTNSQMDGLVHEAKLTGVRVDNAFNDFVMLANSQFMENRVYEDDVTQSPEAQDKPEEKSRDQKEAEVVSRVKEAIQLGLGVVDSMFEIVTVDIGADSDSEDEEPAGEAIMKVKNPYEDRPLPHLIGTQAFMTDDSVGLKEESSEEESEEEEEEESEPESEKRKSESEFSDDLSDSEKDEIIPSRKSTRASSKRQPSSSESDGDLFEKSEEEDVRDDVTSDDSQQKPAQNPFASELAKRIGVAPPGGQSGSEDEWDEQPKPKAKTKKTEPESSKVEKHPEKKKKETKKKQIEEEDDLFAAEESDEPSWLSGGGGLFSGGGGLFDEPAGGLFDDIPDTALAAEPKPKAKEEKSPPKKKPAGGVSLFDSTEDDLFAEPKPEKTKAAPKSKAPSKAPATVAPPAVKDLFVDSDEDDLFASSKPKAKVETKAKAPAVDLFADDEAEDAMFAVPKTKPAPSNEKKKPSLAGAVSMFGGGVNPLAIAVANRRPKSDDEALSDDNRSTASSVTSSRQTGGRKDRSGSASSNSNSLFADEPEEPPAANNRKASQPVPSAIFDDDDENDLFSTAPKPSTEPRKSRATSLFIENEEEEGDLFATKPKTVPAKGTSKEGAPLFSPSEEIGGLFVGAEKKVSSPVPAKKSPPQKKLTISLFDEDEEEEEGGNSDLFAPASKPSSKSSLAPTKVPAQPRKSLFADDDVLFGASTDDPSIDLFGPSSPLTPNQPTVPKLSEAKETSAAPIVTSSGSKPSFPPLSLDGATTTESDDVTPVNPLDAVDTAKKPVSPPSVTKRQTGVAGVSPSATKRLSGVPVGGVSLFGGVDVLGVNKRKSMVTDDEPEPTTPPVENHVTNDVSPRKVTSEESAVSFEQPAEVDTLQSLNKGRVKMGAKRRPPTRRGRQGPTSGPPSETPPSPTPEPKRPTILEIAGPRTETKTVSEPTPRIDDFLDSPDDLFAPKPKTGAKSEHVTPAPQIVNGSVETEPGKMAVDNDLDSPEDLFAVKPAKKEKKKVDIFADEEADIFGEKPKAKSKVAELDDEADDIFSSNKTSDRSKKSKPVADIFADASDVFDSRLTAPPSGGDLFSTPSATSTTSTNKTPARTDPFASDSGEEDIFKTETSVKSKDPFEDDEEDIFATPTTSRAPPTSSRAPPTNALSHAPPRPDEDIFKDDTDIFSDIPKKTKKAKKDASLFNDDVDDIFATPKSSSSKDSTPAKAKTKAKAKKKKSSQNAASIFDENTPNIFDDPLSALQS